MKRAQKCITKVNDNFLSCARKSDAILKYVALRYEKTNFSVVAAKRRKIR